MKKREIEKKLKCELERSVPNVLDKVLAAPPSSQPAAEPLAAERPDAGRRAAKPAPAKRRRAFAAAVSVCLAALLVAVGVLTGLHPWRRPGGDGAIVLDGGGSVYLDINPSVQLVLDEAGLVTAAVPLNEDARVLLKNREKSLVGRPAEQASALVVQYAGEQGYIRVEKKTNAVLVSASLADAPSEKKLERKVAGSIEEQFKQKGIYGVVVTDAKNKDVSDKAAALGVTESKMRLIENVRALGFELSDERAAAMSVADLYDLFEEAAERLSEVLDDDVLNERLEQLEEQGERELERLEDRIEALIETLEEYLEEHGTDEAVAEALDALAEAFDELLDEEDRQDAEKNMRLVAEKTAALSALTLGDAQLEKRIEDFLSGLNEALAAFSALSDKLESARQEAVRLLTAQKQQLAESKNAYDTHAKEKDFDKQYEKWLAKAQREYEEDWDGMKRKWEEDD